MQPEVRVRLRVATAAPDDARGTLGDVTEALGSAAEGGGVILFRDQRVLGAGFCGFKRIKHL